jgi:hypothetical protein
LDDRLAAAREYFREHHSGALPDAGFAARVAARLVPEPLSALGWAAVRLLPAAVALAAVLGFLAARTPAPTANGAASSPSDRSAARVVDRTTDRTTDDDLLTWVLEGRS